MFFIIYHATKFISSKNFASYGKTRIITKTVEKNKTQH